jgi:capsular exopolysaccharide synthesis family protein
MSRLSDESQRSKAECPETESGAPSGETKMTERAELRAVSKWDNAVVLEQTQLVQGAPPARTRVPASAVAENSHTEKPPDPFEQFQSLQVSLTPQSRLVSLIDSGSPAAEAFRLLGVRLRHLRRDRPLKKLLITSTIPQEGKSMVAGNLACTLALRTQQRTLLLEGDLRRPSLSHMFGLGRNPGISECLEDDRSLMNSIYHLAFPNIWILPAGRTPSNALELLQSGKLSILLDQLTALFDWVIIDSPPVLPLADTSVWMRLADGILLTTRQGTTEKLQLQRGLEAIESKKLIGAMVNSSKNAAANDYVYYGPSPVARPKDVPAQ